MKILYIASVRIPNEKASGLAIMRQCEAFAQAGHSTVLLCPYRKNHIQENPFTFYEIKDFFKIQLVYSLDFIDVFGKIGFYITRASQMIAFLFYVTWHHKDIDVIYSRDPWMLFLPLLCSLRDKKTVWEAHQIQRSPVIKFVAKNVTMLMEKKNLLLVAIKISERKDGNLNHTVKNLSQKNRMISFRTLMA